MSLRRRRALADPASRAARLLKQCESRIALLDRVRPLNLADERARLLAGRAERPRYQPSYAPCPDLADVRRALEATAQDLAADDVEQRLLGERARELLLEAELAEHVGKPAFVALAAQRFPLPPNADELEALALELCRAPNAATSEQSTHLSDDARDPDSLLSLLSRRVFSEKLPVRVEVVAGLVPLSAVADGLVKVRAGVRLTAAVAQRIALHEVEGHVLPRLAGQALGGVLLAASAGASEDEEGRAILLEERAGLLAGERRRELGRRYLAAASVRRGAELWETIELLRKAGADDASAIELACRVQRGGGLGRELIYLSGFQRVSAAFRAEPELEQLLGSGRVSLEAARQLGPLFELDDHRNVI